MYVGTMSMSMHRVFVHMVVWMGALLFAREMRVQMMVIIVAVIMCMFHFPMHVPVGVFLIEHQGDTDCEKGKGRDKEHVGPH